MSESLQIVCAGPGLTSSPHPCNVQSKTSNDMECSEPEESECDTMCRGKPLTFEAEQEEAAAGECPRRAFLIRSISNSVARSSGSVAWSEASLSLLQILCMRKRAGVSVAAILISRPFNDVDYKRVEKNHYCSNKQIHGPKIDQHEHASSVSPSTKSNFDFDFAVDLNLPTIQDFDLLGSKNPIGAARAFFKN